MKDVLEQLNSVFSIIGEVLDNVEGGDFKSESFGETILNKLCMISD